MPASPETGTQRPGRAASPAAAPSRGVTTVGRLAGLAGPMMLAVAAQSVANLLLHAVLGRYLPADQYGALGAVLAAMTLVAVPLAGLQTAAAKTTAASGLTRATGSAGLVGSARLLALPTLLLLLAAGPIGSFLHLGSWWDAALLAPTLLVAGLLATARGLLLGAGRARLVAGTFLAAAVLRLALAIALADWLGVTGALLATVLSELVALTIALLALRSAGAGPADRTPLSDLLLTTLVVTGLFAFTTVDLFLARHHLSGAESGSYVAAATIGKTILALPAAAMAVAYPRLVSSWQTRSGTKGALRAALVVVALPALAGALLVAAAPGLVLGVLYGDSFSDASTLVRALAAVAGASSLVSVLAHAALARGVLSALLPWGGAVLQVIGITAWHQSALAIVAVSATSLAVVLASLTILELPAWLRGRPSAAQQ